MPERITDTRIDWDDPFEAVIEHLGPGCTGYVPAVLSRRLGWPLTLADTSPLTGLNDSGALILPARP